MISICLFCRCKSEFLNIQGFAKIFKNFHHTQLLSPILDITKPLETLNIIFNNFPAHLPAYSEYPIPIRCSDFHGIYLNTPWYPHTCVHKTFTDLWTIICSLSHHSRHIATHSPNVHIAKESTQAHTPAFIYLHQSSLFVCTFSSWALASNKLSSTAIPHLHSLNQWVPGSASTIPFPFYFILLSQFSPFLLISFIFHVSDLHIFVHTFQVSFSEYFQIFVHSCTCSNTVASK